MPPSEPIPDSVPDAAPEDSDKDELDDAPDANPVATDAKKKKKKSAKPQQSDPPRVGLNTRTITHSARSPPRSANLSGWRWRTRRRPTSASGRLRQNVHKTIRPGMSLTEIAENVEAGVRALAEGDGLDAGVGFPTGLNINEIAAHFSPNAGDKPVLKMGDILKVDIGVHVKGRILDSAFTMSWAPEYQQLLDAVQAATNTGIREAGIGASLVFPVKPISTFCGHTITPYNIHGGATGKSIPSVKTTDLGSNQPRIIARCARNYAVDTFGSTGRGRVNEQGDCSHYAKIYKAPKVPLRLTSAKTLLKTIDKHFGTLPFARRYLDRVGESKYLLAARLFPFPVPFHAHIPFFPLYPELNHLVAPGVVADYPPLVDQIGSMTSQFEHTILLRPTCKEVVRRGDDF
ncbi:Methionine aminopeptidase 2 [Mycena kentingensis (nom. inval.)]|nr:Methionine aminopeptidase 2 [Mycena kentingensis (nom. inval.)]